MTLDLFADLAPHVQADERLGDQSWVLRGFALPFVPDVLPALDSIVAQAPFRHMVTPGGFTMSVALSNCGHLGWISDRRGYRYGTQDPETGENWPPLPGAMLQLAQQAADKAGFSGFMPDACLINRYLPGTRMSLHQDRNEQDMQWPIVSVSLGIPAMFQFGGHTRSDKTQRVPLHHGDVVVWGGVDRLRFHGVLPLKPAIHPLLGEKRINITFRKAG